MGLKEAAIYLDNELNTYYAGQTVNGRIEYVFDSPKKVRGIQVQFKGEAHTEWRESKEESDDQGKSQTTDTTHSGNEEYFQISYYILGSNSGSEIEIPAGKQVYNFTCALPPVLPSSFEGQHGYVRYTIKVILDRPWKFNQETKIAFTVINALDLNLNPSYKEPIHMQMEKTFCCFCCTSLPLSVDVRAPVSGYCPGQVIPIQIDVENKSNVELTLVKLFLRKGDRYSQGSLALQLLEERSLELANIWVVTYRATSPSTATKKTKEVILTIQQGPVAAGATNHWNLTMEVPPLPPSNLVNCSIIDLDYDLKAECEVPFMHFNMKDKKYITIGTVPLVGMSGQSIPSAPMPEGTQGQPAVIPVSPGQPNMPMGAGGVAPGGWVAPTAVPGQPPYQNLYPTLTQPVYKESPYAARTIQDRGDSNHVTIAGPANFAPYYPTYAAVQPPPLPQ